MKAKDFFSNSKYGNDYNASIKNQDTKNEYIECKNCSNLIFQDCSVQCIEKDGACSDTTFLSTGENDEKENGVVEIVCNVKNGCKKAIFNGTVDNKGNMDMKVSCTSGKSCESSDFNNIFSVQCGYDNPTPVTGDSFCKGATMNNIQTDVNCTGNSSCEDSRISNVGYDILCSGYRGCFEGTFTNIKNNIDCTYQKSCQGLEINYVKNVYCRESKATSQDPTCSSIDVSNAELVSCEEYINPESPVRIGTCMGIFGKEGPVEELQCDRNGCIGKYSSDIDDTLMLHSINYGAVQCSAYVCMYVCMYLFTCTNIPVFSFFHIFLFYKTNLIVF